jgi:hypothetical protein
VPKEQTLLDFKSLKKTADDGKVVTLSHPEGHQVNIAKGALSKPLLKQLDSMPLHQAGGSEEPIQPQAGPMSVEPSEEPPVVGFDLAKFNATPAVDQMSGAPAAGPALEEASGPMSSPENPTPAIDESGDPNAQSLYKHPFNTGEANAANAIEDAAGIEQRGYAKQAQLQNQGADAAQMTQQIFQANMAKRQKDMDDVDGDIRAGHINPNQVYGSGWESAGKHIAASIGLILGGIGGGQTGQGNPALNYLNKIIDNSIDSQKTDMVNKHNLLSAMSRQYGDLQQGELMTRAAMSNILANRISAAANQTNSQLIKSRAQVAIAPILQQRDQMLQRASVMGMLANKDGQLTPANQLQLKGMVGMASPDELKQATTELNKVNEVESLRSGLISSFKDLQGKIAGGSFTPLDRESAINTFAGPLVHLGEGRFNEELAKKQIAAILPAGGVSGVLEAPQTLANKFQRLNQLVDGFRAGTSTLDRLQVNVPRATGQPQPTKLKGHQGFYNKVPGGYAKQ